MKYTFRMIFELTTGGKVTIEDVVDTDTPVAEIFEMLHRLELTERSLFRLEIDRDEIKKK